MQQPEQSWMGEAACRGVSPDLFFPDRGESTAPAKAVCAGCPVSDECLEYAIRGREMFGVFGGLSARERLRLRWRNRPTCPNGHRFDETNRPQLRSDGTGWRCPRCRALRDQQRAAVKAQLSVVRGER